MKKKTAGIIYGVLLFGIMATMVNAQVSTPNFFKKVGNAIEMLQAPWEFGSSSARIAKGWFTNLDSTNATIGNLEISSSVTPGPLTVAASSNPDIRFTGDPNTGISWIDADRMALMTGGTNRLTVNSSGNVGIGTTSPGSALQVNGVTSGAGVGQGVAYINATSAGTYDTVFGVGLNGTRLLTVFADGKLSVDNGIIQIWNSGGDSHFYSRGDYIFENSFNFGIGEGSPASKLSILGGISVGETTDYTRTAAPTGEIGRAHV